MPQYPNALLGTTPPGPAGIFGNVVGQFATILNPGGWAYVFGLPLTTPPSIGPSNILAEKVVAGEASLAVCLGLGQPGNPPPMVSVEVHFAANPGVFEIDVQEADTDADAFYLTPSAAAYTFSAVNGVTFNGRVDLPSTGGKFMRLFMKTITNNVNCWAKITRLA